MVVSIVSLMRLIFLIYHVIATEKHIFDHGLLTRDNVDICCDIKSVIICHYVLNVYGNCQFVIDSHFCISCAIVFWCLRLSFL